MSLTPLSFQAGALFESSLSPSTLTQSAPIEGLISPVVSAVINKLVPLLVIPEASVDDVSVQG